MKKTILLSLIASLSLFAGTIQIAQMPKDSPRQDATSSNVILSYNNAIKDVKQSVVNIATTKKTKQSDQLNELMMLNPFFKEFFGNRLPELKQQGRKSHSLGSGVIISADGTKLKSSEKIQKPILRSLKSMPKTYM